MLVECVYINSVRIYSNIAIYRSRIVYPELISGVKLFVGHNYAL